MNTLHVHSELHYDVRSPTTIVFAVAAARTARQTVLQELLTTSPNLEHEHLPYGPQGHQVLRIQAPPGPLVLHYDARVQLDAVMAPESAQLHEIPFSQLPAQVLHFVNPSRYCESDKLARFASKQFGEMDPGFARVQAVCDWVHGHLDYIAGATNETSSAADVMLQRAGVCRDFAHVAISLCRALGIPARYVSGYAYRLDPQDFHGFFEAYLGDNWYLFDATRMAPVDGLVRIAVGRDAADAAFATLVGTAIFQSKTITVTRIEQPGSIEAAPGPRRVSTA